ncbi:MAG: S-layer homology domain-containing protein [Anaerovoracaceae bacterium]
MKRKIAIILTLTMVIAGVVGAYGAETVIPSDVKDTGYKTAVLELIDRGIINGYPDGTFKPERNVVRGEMAKIADLTIAKDNKISQSQLTTSAKMALDRFSDLGSGDAWSNWAVDYIGYAVEKGILEGYPDGTFRPLNPITYNEVAKILVASLGFKEKDLEGTWPSNYMNKAIELGIMKGFTYKGEDVAVRGNVAMMVYNGFYAGATEEPIEPPKGIDLTQYTAAYGMVNGISEALNKDDAAMKAVELRIGENLITVPAYDEAGNTAIANLNPGKYEEGELYAFRLQRKMGEIIDIATKDDAKSWIKYFKEITPVENSFLQVSSVSDGIMFFKVDGESKAIPFADKCVVYKLEAKSGKTLYEHAKLTNVRKGSKVRLYDITDDKNDYADIIVIDVR